jgi:hypothetical protein
MKFRLATQSVEVPFGEAQELKWRLNDADARGAADAMDQRATAGVFWTYEQKAGALGVLDEWADSSGDLRPALVALREALRGDLRS